MERNTAPMTAWEFARQTTGQRMSAGGSHRSADSALANRWRRRDLRTLRHARGSVHR
jgi:hypothetical protein